MPEGTSVTRGLERESSADRARCVGHLWRCPRDGAILPPRVRAAGRAAQLGARQVRAGPAKPRGGGQPRRAGWQIRRSASEGAKVGGRQNQGGAARSKSLDRRAVRNPRKNEAGDRDV